MFRDPQCVFCRIVAVEIPAAVVLENESLLAFLDVGPLAEGHLLVVPREHFATLVEMPPTTCAHVLSVLPMLGRALLRVTGAEGFNVLINNGSAAGQVVPHVHAHLIPRRNGDTLGYRWNPSEYQPGRAEALAHAFQDALRRLT